MILIISIDLTLTKTISKLGQIAWSKNGTTYQIYHRPWYLIAIFPTYLRVKEILVKISFFDLNYFIYKLLLKSLSGGNYLYERNDLSKYVFNNLPLKLKIALWVAERNHLRGHNQITEQLPSVVKLTSRVALSEINSLGIQSSQ